MNEKHYAQMYVALNRIRSYQTVERLRRHSARDWGLDNHHEAIEMAYENVLHEAKIGLRRVPKPKM